MQNKGLLIGAVVVLIAIAGAAALVTGSKDDTANETGTSQTTTNNSQSSDSSESGTSEVAATTAVTIENLTYSPATIRVKVGDTVTWTNQDSTQHNVVADDPSSDAPDGPLLSKGETYKFTFTKAGTYNYHCTPHPQMQATVIVE